MGTVPEFGTRWLSFGNEHQEHGCKLDSWRATKDYYHDMPPIRHHRTRVLVWNHPNHTYPQIRRAGLLHLPTRRFTDASGKEHQLNDLQGLQEIQVGRDPTFVYYVDVENERLYAGSNECIKVADVTTNRGPESHGVLPDAYALPYQRTHLFRGWDTLPLKNPHDPDTLNRRFCPSGSLNCPPEEKTPFDAVDSASFGDKW